MKQMTEMENVIMARSGVNREYEYVTRERELGIR